MNSNKKIDGQPTRTPATIHALSHDGRGIATVNNKKTFISGALPGETCTFEVTLKRSQYQEADALEITDSSPDRVTPPCQHFGVCGGCSLQHMSAEAQLQLKQTTLLNQLHHFGKVTPETILPPLNALMTGYRRKARLGVKFVIKKNKLLVGFREKASRYLADLESCAVLHPRVGQHLTDLSTLITSLENYQHIPQIEMAMGDQDLALVFRHMQPLPESDIEKLRQFAITQGIHVYLQPNPPEPIHKLWPQDADDRLTYTLPDFGVEFRFYPLDFTQINLEMNRMMVAQALRLLDLSPTDHVLDLFCGIGNFTLPLAKHVAHVTGVEGGNEMVERANENAAHNGITNAQFFAANLMDPPTNVPWMQAQYTKALLDPPRAGAQEILPHLSRLGVQKIVYVSCNPATLARDAGELVHQHGYQLKEVGILNMFPHTSHIEAMAVFTK